MDAGKTWQHMGLPNTNTIARIVIHPENPDIVYVAASGNEYTYNLERGVYKTTDGGQTFQALRDRGLHGDHHALWIDPEDSNHLVKFQFFRSSSTKINAKELTKGSYEYHH